MNTQAILKNIVTIECEPPTYLKHFESEEKSIILAHRVNVIKSTNEQAEDIALFDTIIINDTAEKVDLTGNPLELDLLFGEHNIDVTIVNNTPNNWLKSEILHIPVPLTDAIRFLRYYSENNLDIGDGLDRKIYCICDGLDAAKTVLVGSQRSPSSFSTFQANFKGCFAKNNPAIDLAAMKKEHLEEVGEDLKVSCEIVSKYVLSGFDLKLLTNFNDCNNYGALLMDIYWKDSIGFKFGANNIAGCKLHIQSIAGHRNSPIAVIWEDLLLVHKFINLLNLPADDLEEIILSDQSVEYHDIIKQIDDILQSLSPFRKMLLEEKVEITNFDTFRPFNGIDCFWNVLKRSKYIDDVRSNFHYIFTEAARDKSLHINIPQNSNGFFANMLRGILCGTHAVPTFTSAKALECLVEFGIAKLKSDYLCILDSYNCDTQHVALDIFSVTCDEVPDRRRTVNKRRTVAFNKDNRLTINRHTMTISDLNITQIDTAVYLKQLYLLSGLHMSTQCILLLKDKLDMSSDAFYHTPQYILDHFLGINRHVKSFNDLLRNSLCELSLNISDIDEKNLSKYEILHWNYIFKSVSYKTAVTSIYLHSVDPIFPPCIIKNYVYPDDTEEDIYHTTRFLSIIDSF